MDARAFMLPLDLSGYISPPQGYISPQQQKMDNAMQVADATAARESADYEAAANQQTAATQSSLAMRLAQARQTPGGGIRMGVRRKGLTAGSAGLGLSKANAASRLAKRQAELRAKARQQVEAENAAAMQNTRVSIGPAIKLW